MSHAQETLANVRRVIFALAGAQLETSGAGLLEAIGYASPARKDRTVIRAPVSEARACCRMIRNRPCPGEYEGTYPLIL